MSYTLGRRTAASQQPQQIFHFSASICHLPVSRPVNSFHEYLAADAKRWLDHVYFAVKLHYRREFLSVRIVI